MIGDRLDNVSIEWRDWYGGRDGQGSPRRCTGTVEHVALRTILIRRPRGGLVMKRIARRTVEAGYVSATQPYGGQNLLLAWVADDDAADRARTARVEAAAHDRHAAAWSARGHRSPSEQWYDDLVSEGGIERY